MGRIDKLTGGLAVALASQAQPAVIDELQNLIAALEAELAEQGGGP